MPRSLRKRIPKVTYHVYSRCHNGQNLIELDFWKDMFLEVTSKALEKYRFELTSYQIMDNHFHLEIFTLEGEADISIILQYIKSLFARRYNKMNNRMGAVWNERFKCKIIEEAEDPLLYFCRLKWYMGYNPVRKGMVNDPRNAQYGSINLYLINDFKPPIAAVRHRYFSLLGNTFDECVRRFTLFEEEYIMRFSYNS